mmetsp:Transcript_2771/g.7269  ORF Transcript_2771/g.7269 Transcript_2771/m.7269 type:complete len:410 (-) Transcript_2771:161-1390(-)
MKRLSAYHAAAFLAIAAGFFAFYNIALALPPTVILPLDQDIHGTVAKAAVVGAKSAADNELRGAEVARVLKPESLLAYALQATEQPPATTTIPLVNNTKRVYTCGWDNGNLHRILFPDYRDMGRLDAEPRPDPPSADSVFVLGGGGRCSGMTAQKSTNETGGTALYVNGDGGRLFHAVPESKVEVRAFFGPAVLMSHYSDEHWNAFFDPDKKPTNEGERYLMYLVDRCFEFREKAFDALSRIGTSPAHYGGRCKGLDGSKNATLKRKAPRGEVTPRYDPSNPVPWRDNYKIFRRYRFCLVMEHGEKKGYITEKLINAFLGGCIPIYYGTKEVFEIFNPRAFVFFDPRSPRISLSVVEYLEWNKTAYKEKMREPILANGAHTIREYFSFVDSIGGGVLKGRLREMMGIRT